MLARYIIGEVIGRQPDRIQIAPSQSYPWYGSWAEQGGDGPQLTDWQWSALTKRRLSIGDVEIVTVHREATQREMWWPTNRPPPVFAFDCPVLIRRADGRVKIIAPSGEAKLVAPAPPHIDSDALWAVKPRGARRFGS